MRYSETGPANLSFIQDHDWTTNQDTHGSESNSSVLFPSEIRNLHQRKDFLPSQMKFTNAIIVIASIVCQTHASGHLRSSSASKKSDPIDKNQGARYLVEVSMNMKGQADSRTLEESNETLASELHYQKKLDATLKKQEKMMALGDETITPPSYALHPKEPTKPKPEVAEANTDYGINIVGGDISDANEFPYFGTSLIYPSADCLVCRRCESSLTCRSSL
jgi:hypothetical protein